jgi:AcrR family transcriptional regulator
VAEIASLAEFSVGAVYGFFADKDDLYAQVWLRRGAEFMDGMRAALGSDRSPRERMHDLADFQVAFFRDHAAFARLFLRTAGPVIGPLGATEGTVAGNYTEAMDLQADLFRSGTAGGELRAGDPEVLASMFSGLIAAYQSSDPGVTDASTGADHRMPVDELHAILDAAFAR